MTDNLSHRLGHRGVYKYVLTQGTNGWRCTVVNGNDQESDPSTVIAILQEALANCQKSIDAPTT
jgi:hypothetical protein